MPVRSCRSAGKPGYKWGERGKCYTYPPGNDRARREAKRKAVIQGIAAGERPTNSLTGEQLTALLEEGREQAEALYLERLTNLYMGAIVVLAKNAQERFALVAAADWQPPAEGVVITEQSLAALAASLSRSAGPVWTRIVVLTALEALSRIEIAWDVKHPLAAGLIERAAERTGVRLGDAVQPVLRKIVAQAYDEGLNVRDTAEMIRSGIRESASWQAEMLARTDLNSLANGASRHAAKLAGMGFKTWDATLDDRTRPEHDAAHGQTVPIDGMFSVGGEEAEYPGDPNLSNEMACNCRCSLVYGDSQAEAEGLLASADELRASDERDTMTDVATRRQRRKRGERRAAKQPKGEKTINWEKLTPEESEKLVGILKKADPKVPILRVPEEAPMDELLEETPALTAAARAIPFHGTAMIEGKLADDTSLAPRVILPQSLTWEEMPRPFMAQTVTAEGHDGAQVAGRIDSFKRKRATGRMRDILMNGEFTNPFGIDEIAPMVEDGTMRYVSADLAAAEFQLVRRDDLTIVPREEADMAALNNGEYALGVTSGKIKAVTLVPSQAIEGAYIALTAAADEFGAGFETLVDDDGEEILRVVFAISDLALVAAADVEEAEELAAMVASPAPVAPPLEWFTTPEPPGKMPLTVMDDGRVYGHLATWDSCHVSFLPSCVPPPKSPSNYARFHVCELDTAEGHTVTVGKLMFSPNGGHADRRISAQKASQYYDRTGMAAAYLRVTDGKYGIWAAGALNPKLSDEQREEMRRELRLNPPSGDWRPVDGQYELICALAVAVPGFPIPRAQATVTVVASAEGVELEDAIIASSGLIDPDPAAVAALDAIGLHDEEAEAEARMRVLAARAEGIDAVAALVGGDE